MEFYTNATIVADFKDYIKHLITHKNPYTGLTYANDPTIAIYETGNELGGPTFGDMDVPNAWTQEIAVRGFCISQFEGAWLISRKDLCQISRAPETHP